MSLLSQTFSALKRRREKALVLFMTAGDPSARKTWELLPALEKEGVDIVEIGVPFSDPLADGPAIQASSQRALRRGMNLAAILRGVRRARRGGCRVPIVLMGYYNPIFRYGDAKFARGARAAGVDGVIVPDMPIEESAAFSKLCRKAGLDLIHLAAPTSTPERKRRLAAATRGFLYYVSLTGVTGVQRALPSQVASDLRRLKRVCAKPVCVGFGITEPAQARAVSRAADGVIIGSAFVRYLAAHASRPAVETARKFARPFLRALGRRPHA